MLLTTLFAPQAASREQTEAASTTAAPPAVAADPSRPQQTPADPRAPGTLTAEHDKLSPGSQHLAGSTPATDFAPPRNQQLPLSTQKSLSASMLATATAQARADDAPSTANGAQTVPSTKASHLPSQGADHPPSKGTGLAPAAAAASSAPQNQAATSSGVELPDALRSTQGRSDVSGGIAASSSAAKEGAASIAKGTTDLVHMAAPVPAAAVPHFVSAVRQAVPSPSKWVTTPVAARLQAAIEEFQSLPVPSDRTSTALASTGPASPGVSAVTGATNDSVDPVGSNLARNAGSTARSAEPIRPVIRTLSAAFRAGRDPKQTAAHSGAAGASESARQAGMPASQPKDLPAAAEAVSTTEPAAASSLATGQSSPTAASVTAHVLKPAVDRTKASNPSVSILHAHKPAAYTAQAPQPVTDPAQIGAAAVSVSKDPQPVAHGAPALTQAATQMGAQDTEASLAQTGVAAQASKQSSSQPAKPYIAADANPPQLTAVVTALEPKTQAAADQLPAAASLHANKSSAISLAGSARSRGHRLRLDRSLPASTTPASVAVSSLSTRSVSATAASATPASVSAPRLSSASASAAAAATKSALSVSESLKDPRSRPVLTLPLPQHGPLATASGMTVKIQTRQLNPDGNLGPTSPPQSSPNAALPTVVPGSSAPAGFPSPKATATAQSKLIPGSSTPASTAAQMPNAATKSKQLVPGNSAPVSPVASQPMLVHGNNAPGSPAVLKPDAVTPSTSADPGASGKRTVPAATSTEAGKRKEVEKGTAAAGASPQHKAVQGITSPLQSLTNAASDFEAKAHRRHLLQQDSSTRRMQMCMEKLKTARLDMICWLRIQKKVSGCFADSPSLVTSSLFGASTFTHHS